jgi:hypothetical protein
MAHLHEAGDSVARVAGESNGREGAVGTLSVVVPVFNEKLFVQEAVDAVRRAADRAGWPVHVIVVDDGSTDPESVEALRRLATADDVTVDSLATNHGRYAARARGLKLVTTPYVLLLDARVVVEPDTLVKLREQVERHQRDIWNFDVETADPTLFALFWTGITKVWWRDYFRDRKHIAFTDVDFDRYPKGTGAFFAPVAVLRAALGSFESLFDDPTMASDDTRLLRNVAGQRPINIAPEILCKHRAKSGGAAWVRQCRYRGTTFVDGYLGDADRAGPMLVGAAAAAVVGATWALRRPGQFCGAAAALSVGTAALTAWAGGSAREAASVGVLTLPFGLVFGSGAVRGLVMAAKRR